MPSPLELIKNGILNNDLKLIAEGYKGLTGQDVVPTDEQPPKKRGRPKKGALVLPGSKEFDEEIEVQRSKNEFEAPARGNTQRVVSQPARNKRKSRWEEIEEETNDDGKSLAKREPINPKKIKGVGNLFVDDLTLDTQDRNKWKKAYPKNPVNNSRPSEKMIKIKCSRCKDVYELFRSEIVNDPFICNDCTTSVGR